MANRLSKSPLSLPQWHINDNRLVRIIETDTYLDALNLVQKVGLYAEKQDHHPDLLLHYKELTIKYWTHTEGGVTEKDVACAEDIEKIISQTIK